MSAKLVFYGLVTLAVLALAGCGILFWIQNSSHHVTTSFEFWGLGRHGRIWKAPELIAVSGGIGFALGFILAAIGWSRSASAARTLRRQVAIGSSSSGSSGSSSSFR